MTDARHDRARGFLHNHRMLATVAGVLVAGIFIASSLIVLKLWQDRPNLYNPARIDIVKAQRHLYEAYGQSTKAAQLREEIRATHLSLEDAAALLNKAEGLDPSQRQQIAVIRRRLTALEDSEKTERMTPKELHDAYQKLSEELAQLAQALE
jgi:DNA repair ATPase RecN